MMAKKLTEAQRRALEALAHDDETRAYLVVGWYGKFDHYTITNHQGFAADVREPTLRALSKAGYIDQDPRKRWEIYYRITAKGRDALNAEGKEQR
jgi:hypothetical protein